MPVLSSARGYSWHVMRAYRGNMECWAFGIENPWIRSGIFPAVYTEPGVS